MVFQRDSMDDEPTYQKYENVILPSASLAKQLIAVREDRDLLAKF